MLDDNDNISITKVCTKVCLSPKTQRSDDYFIEVIPESTDETEKLNNIKKDIKSKVCIHAKLLQLCTALRDPMDCSPPGSSVHGILQARILQWVVISSSMRSSQPRDQTCVFWGSYIAEELITTEPPGKPKSKADNCKCDKVIFQRQKISLKKESFYSI